MRFVKIAGWSLLAIFILLVLGAAAVVLLVDPNDYKDEIAVAVKNKTGRELSFQGDLGLSIFPWLAIDLGHTELGNAPGFDNVAFAVIKNANVGVKLLPLLRGELEIGRIRLDGLQLNLAKNAQGRTNWEDLLKSDEPAQPAGESRIKSTSIAGLTVENSGLDYVDEQAGSRKRITDLSLETQKLRPGEPIDVKLAFNLDEGPGTRALPLKLAVPGLQLDLDRQTLQAPTFELGLASATVRGTLTGQKIVDAPAFSGRIALQETSPRQLFKDLGMEAPVTRDPKVLSSLSFESSLNATTDSVELPDLKLKLDNTQMTGRFAVPSFDPMALRFGLKVDRLDLERYLGPEEKQASKGTQEAGGKASDPLQVLRELNAKGTLDVAEFALKPVQLKNIKLRIDSTKEPMQLGFDSGGGAIEGMDLWYEIRRARALLKREALPADASSGRTAFKTLKGSATVAGSVLANRDLDMQMDYLQVAGAGTVNLDNEAVDYKLTTTVYDPPQSGAGAELQDLKSAQIPVKISGTLSSLKVRPDLDAQLKAEAKKKIEEKKGELKDKLTDKLNKWLQKK